MLIDSRNKFEQEKLVFVVPQQKWYSPSQCLWTKSSQISGKFAIREQYETLERFFLDVLGVAKPDIGMLVGELKSIIIHQPNIDKVKELIWGINAMGPRTENFDEIRQLGVLPIQLQNGKVELRSVTTDFALVDRANYASDFKGQISLLDFSLGQVHRLKPFLTAFGLDDRLLSKLVQETSNVEGRSFATRLTNEFRQKASAFFRSVLAL